jgi:hypothetical protein
MLFSWCLIFAGQAKGQAPMPDSPAIETQTHEPPADLMLEQKIQLLAEVDQMFELDPLI